MTDAFIVQRSRNKLGFAGLVFEHFLDTCSSAAFSSFSQREVAGFACAQYALIMDKSNSTCYYIRSFYIKALSGHGAGRVCASDAIDWTTRDCRLRVLCETSLIKTIPGPTGDNTSVSVHTATKRTRVFE